MTEQTATNKKKKVGTQWLKVDGVVGEGKHPGYEGCFAMEDLSFGVGVGVGRSRGRRRGVDAGEPDTTVKPKRRISEPSISEVTVTINDDVAAPVLLHSATNRGLFPEISLFCLSPYDKLEVKMVMKDVAISGFSLSVGRRDQNTISLSLNFEEILYYSASELRRPINLPLWANKTEANLPPATVTGQHGNISILPDELMQHVFSYFESKELFQAGLACKRWARISSSPSFEKIISHDTSYNITSHTVLLDGVNIPTTYAEGEGDDDY